MESTNTNSYSVIGIGNPTLDIIGKIKASDIKRFNLTEGKTNNADESNIDLVEQFEKIQNSADLKYLASGSAINTIKVINWLTNDLDYIPRPVIIGSTACDRYGQLIKLYLTQQKVKYLLQELKDVKTSRCIVGISDDNKSRIYKVNQIRASALLDKKYVQSKKENIMSSEILFIEGYFVLGKYEIVEYLLTEYDKSGRKIAFNVSAPFICEKKKEEVKNIFTHADFVFATDEEIAKFLGKSFDSAVDLSKAFHEALENKTKKRYLVLLKGKWDYLVSSYDYNDNDVTIEYENTLKFDDVAIRDLSGTREAFIGGFLAGVLRKKDFKNCVRFGIFAYNEVKKNVSCSFNIDSLPNPL